MPQAIIYLDERLNIEIGKESKLLNLSKHDIILKILKEHYIAKYKGGK